MILLEEHHWRWQLRARFRLAELLGGPQQLGHRQPHLLSHVRGERPGREARVLPQRARRRRTLILFRPERLEDERGHDGERREQERQCRYTAARSSGEGGPGSHVGHARLLRSRQMTSAWKYAAARRPGLLANCQASSVRTRADDLFARASRRLLRQDDRENAPFAVAAADAHRAAQPIEQLSRDAQPKTRPAVFARSRSVDLTEILPDRLQILLANSDAGVHDVDADAAAAALRAARHYRH